ncbi:hypothetical protein LEM8419_03386 [Neolewinella maritima]|uniref:ASPIC/UnbV domain-containing protein n=1 Tax=Neolewinella maritima TaxID=1383882 RepID=A0ABN8FE73_9BACT|nr:VCBS repeat-containing protein [Neolewinella maritima]CAH1002507.1 hypothetical protein LEM8419_03386 [Neolewinella maritima]
MRTAQARSAPDLLHRTTVLACSVLIVLFCACEATPPPLLEPQSAATTGVHFVNRLVEDDTTNILYNEYLYNGGGVGVGDFDGNGLPDLFFGGNKVSSRLYLQLAPWQFTDVTELAGLTTSSWISGVNVHDVNGDGSADLYLTVLNPTGALNAPNLLFINQGNGEDGTPTFREAAAAYGLDNPSYSVHSAWFDLEQDGDLDLYLLNNAIESASRKTLRGTDSSGTAPSLDVVYRNDGPQVDGPQFTRTNDIKMEGWGLGVVPHDFNLDGTTDLYVANDFISDDALLLNATGRLQQRARQAFVHTSKNSMGVDAADLNNDGYPDIVTADMLPDDNLRKKTMFSDIPFQLDARAQERGYVRQYVRNTLQVSNRDGTYSDLAFLAGIAATDWSWAPLIADFDNNGHRDVFISNGYLRDVTNRDFVDFAQQTAMFGTDEAIMQNTLAALHKLAGVHQPNYVFGNRGELDFFASDWLPPTPTYSNGAVYVDLDRDGDLDLVTNNINEPAGLYRNQSRERAPDSTHYLLLQLDGPPTNLDALGAKVYLSYGEGQHSYAEQQRQRGYLSTVDALLHFGLGTSTAVDTLVVIWPDGRVTERTKITADQCVRLSFGEGTAPARRRPDWVKAASPTLREQHLAGPTHVESPYSDFDNFALAVRDRSHDGPALAAADLDGDKRSELIVGGAAGEPTTIYRQTKHGLVEVQVLEGSEASEATTLVTLDYDGDGDTDLFVGNGSREFTGREVYYRDLLYANVGGTLELTQHVLPALFTVTATAVAADLEGDGDQDLFVGSAYRAGAYPEAEASYVLRNEGGKYVVGQQVAAGLVTDAVWTDLNGDRLPDLMTVGEYAPPTVYLNRTGTLEAQAADEALAGWWYSLSAADLDGDGDTDLLAGNVGLNSAYHASPQQPLELRVADYDDNGTLDPIMTMYIADHAHPVHPRNTLGRQLPGFKKQATTYAMYGSWAAENMPPLGEKGFLLQAKEFRSVYLENDGSGHFTTHYLPKSAQTAPIRDALPVRLPNGRTALLAVQNDYALEVLGGRLDAGTGFALSAEGGTLRVDPDYWSVRGDARSVVQLDSLTVVGINSAPLRYFKPAGRWVYPYSR